MKRLATLLFIGSTVVVTSCSSVATDDNSLACRNYRRTKMDVSQTIVDWTNKAATDSDVASAFKKLGDASSDNATFVKGSALTAFSDAATVWKNMRVAVVTGDESQLTAAAEKISTVESAVKSVCALSDVIIP